MKNKLIIFAGIVLYMIVVCSCTSDDDNMNESNIAEIQAIETTVQAGIWRITYYYDSDHEETDHFNGFNFTFSENGILTATNTTDTHIGNWSVTGSSSDDNDDDDIDFNIFFSTPSDFNELSDDWDIISRTSSKLELIDISGGNGGTDYLTFEKQ